MSAPLSPQLLAILQHSLGVDEYGQGNQYRNHFVTGPGCADYENCVTLVEMGLMRNHGLNWIGEGNRCFTVTEEGKNAVAEQSPKPPKLSKGRRIYRAFLDVADAFPDLTFKEFLTSNRFSDCRKNA